MANVIRKIMAYTISSKLTGISQKKAYDMVNYLQMLISQKAFEGKKIMIFQLGTFDVTTKEARPGRNVVTKEMVLVCKRQRLNFRVSRFVDLDAVDTTNE